MKRAVPRRLSFEGLVAAPSQVVGAVRLVPLVRTEPIDELRLFAVPTGADLTVAQLDRRTVYTAYVPHTLVAELPGAGPCAALGSQLVRSSARARDVFSVQVVSRLARREGPGRLRLLPQHLGLDAYLSVGFSGPNVRWPEYARRVLSRGLSPRSEGFHRGGEIPGFADALRVFEIHPGQAGVLVFVADAFASAFVTPHEDDYRRLHPTLLRDLYGALLVQYAVLYPEAPALWEPLDEGRIDSLDALAAAVDGLRGRWAEFAAFMASGLLEASLMVQQVQRLGGFRLARFVPGFHPQQENHVGEMIEDQHGRLAYLSTTRLSAAQARRGRLLATLVDHDWNLVDTAEALGCDSTELQARLRNNGLGGILKAR